LKKKEFRENKKLMIINGYTSDKKIVVGGVFSVYSSLTGLPLEDIINILYKNDMIIDWLDFYNQAMKEGWKPDRTIIKIKGALEDSFGLIYSREVIKRLKFCLNCRNKNKSGKY